jgi:4-carboxymuconolactone decarboxylase
MGADKKPRHYQNMVDKYPEFIKAAETLGKTVKTAGPLDEKAVLLIQLGAAAAMRSDGSVTSHAKRALAAGCAREEIDHALVALASVIGFPSVAAALKWTADELDG